MKFKTVDWIDNQVILIDQTKLPLEETYVHCQSWQEVGDAIKTMIVRGAPAIGVTAALGYLQASLSISSNDIEIFKNELEDISNQLISTRPTAVNLAWAINNLEKIKNSYQGNDLNELKNLIRCEAIKIFEEDISINKTMGSHGAELIDSGDTILTHCNAGALATGGYGTALGVIYAAHAQGKNINVLADETRPFLQGARLTCWELQKNNIPTTLITDNMSGHLMSQGLIQKIVVGADRIAANGDVANKIGTYMVAVLAKRHNIPFYVAAPLSTIDLDTKSGNQIPIEERPELEVTHVQGKQICPHDISIRNPAFDITPAELVSGIITEKGVVAGDYEKKLPELFE